MAILNGTIQHRRGAAKDFDASKMLPGEFAVTTDGSRKVLAAFGPGDVKELASKEEVEQAITEGVAAIEEKEQQALNNIGTGVDNSLTQEGKAADAGATGKAIDELKGDLAAEVKRATEAEDNRIKKFYTSNLGAVSVPDSDDGAVRDLVIGGRSEQVQTNGYNLCDGLIEKGNINAETMENVDAQDRFRQINYIDNIDSAYLYFEFDRSISNLGVYGRCLMQDGSGIATTFKLITSSENVYKYKIVLAEGTVKFKFVIESSELVNLTDATFIRRVMVSVDDVPWEPYTGGAPSPSPDYPQEIKCVQNCSITVENADGTETQSAPIPFTLRGIGDVRDELYVYADGTGKLVQRVGAYTITGMEDWNKHTNSPGYFVLIDIGQKKTNEYNGIFSHFQTGGIGGNTKAFIKGDSVQIRIDSVSTVDELKTWLAEHQVNVIYYLDAPIEITLTAEQVKALFDLRTYYGGTNITYESDNGVEPVVNFDYACALENFVEYIKAAQGDDRKFIYDMGERMTDAEYVAAMAYVNSEYASALAELMEV